MYSDVRIQLQGSVVPEAAFCFYLMVPRAGGQQVQKASGALTAKQVPVFLL